MYLREGLSFADLQNAADGCHSCVQETWQSSRAATGA
jgi:hypothetical protein